MAGKVVREFIIRINSKGQIEAVRDYKKLDKTLNETAKSAGETDRAMKGVAQATSNSTKSFAKQAQGLGGIVRIYATVAANVFALSSAYNVLKRNADLEILRRSSEQLSITTGQNYNLIGQQLKNVTGGAIGFREAMQSANLALSGGLSGTQATQIATIATKAANALGRSVPEAVQRLTQAIVKAEPELADEFGIVLRVTEATNEYARSLGKLPTQLTTAQKQQAIFNQFLEQGTEKFANVQIQTNPYDKLAASFVDLTNKVVAFVRVPLDPIINLLSESGIALAGVFAAVAGGIAKLLLPQLKELSTKMAESANLAKSEAFEKYTKSVEKAAIAQRRLNADIDDYVSILQSGIKKSQLDKIDLGAGIDTDQLARELDSASGNIGLEVRENILKNVFLGDESKMRKTVGTFVKGLEKQIKTATDKGFKNVSFGGFVGSITEAQRAVEALGIATKTVSELEKEAALSSEVAIQKKINKYRVLTAEVQKYAATLKFVTTAGYAEGLEKGLFRSILGIKNTFKELSSQVGGGLLGNIAGIFGTGSKLAGGFLSTMIKVVGLFGQWGLVISVLTTVFGPLIDKLDLADKNSEKIENSLVEYGKAADTTSKSIELLGKKSVKSFEDQVEASTTSINILKSIDTNLNNLVGTFELLGQTQNSFWRLFNDNAESAVNALVSVSKAYKQALDLGPQFNRQKSEEQFGTFTVGTSLNVDDTGSLTRGSGRSKSIISADRIIDNINDELSSIPGAKATVGANGIEIVLPTNLTADQAQTLARASVLGQGFINAEEVGRAQIAATQGVIKSNIEAEETVRSFSSAYEDLSKNLADTATKVNGANQEYSNVNNVIERYNDLVSKGATEEANKQFATLNPQLVSIIERYSELGEASKNATPKQAVDALKVYREELARFATDASVASATQAKLKTELIAVQDAVRRGDTSQLTKEYRLQRELIDSQIVSLRTREAQAKNALKLAQSGAKDSDIIRQRTAELNQIEAQILELKKKQNVEYGEQVANEKILVESAKARTRIASINLNLASKQANVIKAIATETGDTSTQKAALHFEQQILSLKLQQIEADAAAKRAEASGASGDKAAILLAEAAALDKQKRIEQDLFNIRQSSGQRDLNIERLELENKTAQQVNSTREATLNLEKGLADVRAGDLFLSNQARDAAELLSLQKDIQLVEANRSTINTDIALIQSRIGEEAANIARLRSKGYDVSQNIKRIQELQVDLAKKENEARSLIVESEKAITAEREEQFEIAKKNASLFDKPQEFIDLLGENFRRAAEDFGRAMGSEIDRITDITLGVIDSGINAFVDAIAAGENALQAATIAIKDTFLQLNNELIKDQFKKLARQGLSSIFGKDSGIANLGKSEELIEAETQTSWLQKIFNVIKGGPGGIFTPESEKESEDTASIFSNLTQWVQDTFTSVKDVFSKIGTNISNVIGDGIKGITDFIGNIDFSGIFNSISSALSGIGGGGGASGFASLASTAISLFFAKGGVTGEIMKRIPMYANGGITNGPEIAMVGEGPKREAIVPLPDNRSIPVTINGNPDGTKNIKNIFNINITGIQGTEEGISRSANQIALRLAQEQARAQGRIG